MRILKLPRSLVPGTIVYRLKGSDPDPDVLTFGLKGPKVKELLEIRTVSFTEADVILKSHLKDKEYNLTVFVTDGSKQTEVDSTIIVTEVDSSQQVASPFINLPPLFAISENATKNTTIGHLVARDRNNSNLAVTFELRGSDKFAIRYVFGPRGTSKAEVLLVGTVDYERQNLYSMTVVALNAWTNSTLDTRNVATADILIAIKDVQDTAPKFVGLPNIVRLDDDLKEGSDIITIHADDGDYGSQRNVTYTFEESKYSQYFSLSAASGLIGLKKSLKLLKLELGAGSPFLLSIVATEVDEHVLDSSPLLSTHEELAMVIISSENHAPEFASERLYGSIAEHSSPTSPVRWNTNSIAKVFDGDPGANGTMTLSIEDDTGMFAVQPYRGQNEIYFSVVVKNGDLLDYENVDRRKAVFTIIAIDGSYDKPLSSKIVCIINITDVNDHYPQFSQSSYNATFYEDSPLGTTVAQIKAFDADSGNFGKIKYTAISGPIANNLHLNVDTGIVTLVSLEGIDREKISFYRLTVEVRDENGLGNGNSTELFVKVLDANDNEPKFLQSRYDAVLNSDRISFTQPIMVKAIDRDELGPNNNVTYEIIEGNVQDKFEINKLTGEISLRSGLALDRSAKLTSNFMPDNDGANLPTIGLKVRAHDQGIPYMSSTVMVYIHSQNFLNRSVSFILNSPDYEVRQRKSIIERGLSSMTGALVHINSIQPQVDRSDEEVTVLDTWVAYPVRTTVDLRDFSSLSVDIMGKKSAEMNREKDFQSASLYHGEYDAIFWTLMVLVILTIVFLVILVSCLCYYKLQKDKEKKTIVSETWTNDHGQSKQSLQKSSDTGRSGHDNRGYDETDMPSSVPDNYHSSNHARSQPTRVKKFRNRMRVAPDSFDRAMSEENQPSGRPRRDLEAGHGLRSLQMDSGVHSTETYNVEDGGQQPRTHSTRRPQQTEIMYIRSPPTQPRSVSEQGAVFDEEDEEELDRTPSPDYDDTPTGTFRRKGRRQVSFKTRSGVTVPGKVSSSDQETPMFKNRKLRSESEVSLSSQTVADDRSTTVRQQTPIRQRPSIAVTNDSSAASSRRSSVVARQVPLPGAVGDDDGHEDDEDVQTPDSTTHVKQVANVSDESEVASVGSVEKVLIIDTKKSHLNEIVSDKSDSDSGLGQAKNRSERLLSHKNSDMMQKKSVFTIAYDGVKTNRLKSAESGRETP